MLYERGGVAKKASEATREGQQRAAGEEGKAESRLGGWPVGVKRGAGQEAVVSMKV